MNPPTPHWQLKLSQVGERKIIERIRRRFAQAGPGLLTGIGDDAAVLSTTFSDPKKKDLLWTTDVLVEGVDFDLRHCTFHQVGFKAMAANLSDIAAMGGVPKYYLATLGLSGALSIDQLDQLYEGMAELADEYQVRLIGGDLSASPGGIFVGVTMLGEVEKGRALLRSGAKLGDLIFVTGTVGDAAAGLEVARNHRRLAEAYLPLLQRQFYPVPRIQEGRLFCTQRIATAMIDLSDGLASDLRRLCEESRVGAVVEAAALPLSKALMRYAQVVQKDPLSYALAGGEDFELLFTVPSSKAPSLITRALRNRIKLSRIGRILSRTSGIKLKNTDGRLLPFPPRGYEHFIKSGQ